MNANEVLIDILEDNRRRLHRVIEPMPEACLHWQHEAGANSIMVTMWHMGRFFDLFAIQFAMGEAVEGGCWFRNGWAERTGYDPRGIGRDGWGTVNGYTLEEVAAIPRLTREEILAFVDEVYDTVRAYLESIPMDELQTPGTGFEGKYTRYQFVQMALLDNIRHLGEIFTIKSMWDRRSGG